MDFLLIIAYYEGAKIRKAEKLIYIYIKILLIVTSVFNRHDFN